MCCFSFAIYPYVLHGYKGDVQRLLNLHLDCLEQKVGKQERQRIEDEALHLYATNNDVFDHNMSSVSKIVTKENPIAMVKTKSLGKHGMGVAHHFDKNDETLETSFLCKKARVALRGRNFCPGWGLHNGACGIVLDIVFREGENPNNGDQPLYVVVEFPHYIGPAWDKNNAKAVPIPVTTANCKYQCCARHFMPLCLAYARTIHKFQGLSAGPVDNDKIKNFYDVIVCDPGDRSFEARNPGLLYTAVSRATTLGDEKGIGSAIYFKGKHMKNGNRIRNLTRSERTGEIHQGILQRTKWVQKLNENTLQYTNGSKDRLHRIPKHNIQRFLFKWATGYVVAFEELTDQINKYSSWMHNNPIIVSVSSATKRKPRRGRPPKL